MAKKKAKGKKKKGLATGTPVTQEDRALKKLLAKFKGHAAGPNLAAARLRSDHLDTLPVEYSRLVDAERELDVNVSCRLVENVPEGDMRWAFALLQENMKLLYEGSEWGWHERDKLKEMHAEGMHYFFVTAPVDSTASNSSSSMEGVSGAAENVGFASGFFDLERGEPVFYLYEIMVTKAMQAKGLGSKLMDVFEMVGAAAKMPTAMLTCFTANTKAEHFFERRGYVVSDHSPPKGSDYGIRAKGLAALNVPVRAEVAASAVAWDGDGDCGADDRAASPTATVDGAAVGVDNGSSD